MDAPTEWTYGGKIDWSSPEKLKFLPVQLPLRCIIEAIKERHNATPLETYGYPLPAFFSAPYNPLSPLKAYTDAI